MEFPIYRKYSNNKNFYKIESKEVLEELQLIGKSYAIIRLEAKILPEFNLIQDLIDNKDNRWEASTALEYDEQCHRARTELKQIG